MHTRRLLYPLSERLTRRKYRDLVNRHEKSFHPLADNIKAISVEQDVAAMDNSRLRTLPTLPQSGHVQTHSLTTTPYLPSYSGADSTSHAIINRGGNGPRNSQSTASLSPPHSVSIILETEAHVPISPNVPPHLETASVMLADQNGIVADTNEGNASEYTATIMDQLRTEMIPDGDQSQHITDANDWNTSDMIWADSNSLTVEARLSNALNEPPSSHVAPGNFGDGYYDNIDILSMIPRGGVDLEAEFSAYLFNSGYSPTEREENTGRIPGNSPGPQLPCLGVNELHSMRTDTATIPININTRMGTFARMPSVTMETPRKLPVPTMDLETYDAVVTDLKSRITSEQLKEMDIPSSQDMQKFLTSYFTCFHCHCPIIHIPSLDLKTTPSHLLFAICSIGALYRLSRRTARDLWYWADHMVGKVSASKCTAGDFATSNQT